MVDLLGVLLLVTGVCLGVYAYHELTQGMDSERAAFAAIAAIVTFVFGVLNITHTASVVIPVTVILLLCGVVCGIVSIHELSEASAGAWRREERTVWGQLEKVPFFLGLTGVLLYGAAAAAELLMVLPSVQNAS